MFLQNSLQATGKLRAIYLGQEEKRPDTEQQLRSWVSKVETQIGEEGKKVLIPRRWSISSFEPAVTTGTFCETSSANSGAKRAPTHVSSNYGNVFAMEDYFSSEKPIEVLMASTCPQLFVSESKPASNPAQTPSPQLGSSVRSASALASIGVTPTGLAGAVAKGTSNLSFSGSLPVVPNNPSPLASSPQPNASQNVSPTSLAPTTTPPTNHKRIASGGNSNPSSSSATQTANDQSKTVNNTSSQNNSTPSVAHIVVELNDLIMLVGQDAVLTFSLYAEDKFITEEFPIMLPNQSPIVVEEKSKKVVFRDLPIEMLTSSLYLVAKIVRFGRMKYNEAKPSAKDSHEGYPVRRPYAAAVLPLSEVISTAQAEQDVQDVISSGSSSQESMAVRMAATLRRRQFSNAPRPALKSETYDVDASPLQSSSSSHNATSMQSSSHRPTSPSNANSRKVLKDTLRHSALRAQAAHAAAIVQQDPKNANLASVRSLGYVKAVDKFMTLYAPTRDEIFPDMHSYIINNLNDKAHYLTFLPKAKGLLVHISKFEGAFNAVQQHPAFVQSLPISICQPLFLPDQNGMTFSISSSNSSSVSTPNASNQSGSSSSTSNSSSSTNNTNNVLSAGSNQGGNSNNTLQSSSSRSEMSMNFGPRNDLYITIEEALLHDDKSFEILVEARNKFGTPASVAPMPQTLSTTSNISSSNNNSISSMSGTGMDPKRMASQTNLNSAVQSATNQVLACPVLPLWANPPTMQGIPVSPFSAFQPAHIVHRSIPYHHKKDPRPMETFKMDLSRFSDVDHLYMTIRHVGESGKVSDPFAFATLRLYQQDASFIPNGTRKLNTYKPGTSSSGGSTSDLLSKRSTLMSNSGPTPTSTAHSGTSSNTQPSHLPSGLSSASRSTLLGSGVRNTVENESHVASYLKNEESLPRSNKSDFLTVSVNLVSTKITENIPLRALLNWQNSTAPDMSPLLEKCAHISRKDIVNFYKDIFDTLLDLLVLLDDVRANAFQTLLAILATCQSDPRNSFYDQLDPRGNASLKHWVDKYLEEGGLKNIKVWPILMDSLHKLIAAVYTDPKANHKTLKLALKASPMLIKFILRSRQLALQTNSSSPSLPDYSASGTQSKTSKSTDPSGSKGSARGTKLASAISGSNSGSTSSRTGPVPSISGMSSIGANSSFSDLPSTSPRKGVSDCFLSHGFVTLTEGNGLEESDETKQTLFNPLFNLPQVKFQQPLFAMLSEDTNFRKRFLALLESFSQLLTLSEPSLITLQALLVKAVPQMLQSAVFVLDREHCARFIERFLTALDDADQQQLSIEKLLFLENFQFSPYISLSILIKHIKTHARETDEERFIALRILKSMMRSILTQTFLGTLSSTSPIAIIEAHPEGEMDAEYTSATHLSSSSSSINSSSRQGSSNHSSSYSSFASNQNNANTSSSGARTDLASIFGNSSNSGHGQTPNQASATKLGDASGSVSPRSSNMQNSSSSQSSSITSEKSFKDRASKRISKSPRGANLYYSFSPHSTPRALYLVLLDLVPTLSRVMRKSDEGDAETRRDVTTIFLALLKIVSLKRLKEHLQNLSSKHTKSLLESLLTIVLLQLKQTVYPLGWNDLVLHQLRRITLLLQHVLVPVVIQSFGTATSGLSDAESKMWVKTFCILCYTLRHPAIQLESYVANREAIISYLGGNDPRIVLARGLWALWNRFQDFRMQLVPNAIPALLALSSSPNVALSKLSRRCYLNLVAREAEIVNFMNSPHFERVYPTVQPNRPRNDSKSSSTSNSSQNALPVRIVGAPGTNNSTKNSSFDSSSPPTPHHGVQVSPSSSSSSIISNEIGTNSNAVGETTRARSNNATASPVPRPAAAKRGPLPLVSSGSSGNISNIGRQHSAMAGSGAGNTGNNSSASVASRHDPIATSNIASNSLYGMGDMSISAHSQVSFGGGMVHSNSGQNFSGFGANAYSFNASNASGNASNSEKNGFPRVEVATIQALEELSKSGVWSQKSLEIFFLAIRDLANTAIKANPTANSSLTSANSNSSSSAQSSNASATSSVKDTSSTSNNASEGRSPRSTASGSFGSSLSMAAGSSSSSIDQHNAIIMNQQLATLGTKTLFVEGGETELAKILPKSLVQAMTDTWESETLENNSSSTSQHLSSVTVYRKRDSMAWGRTKNQSDESFSLLNSSINTLNARLLEFAKDMMSLVLLLASMRDLPQGAEYDEERAYSLTQLMTYLRQTQHADAYLKYAYKLSKMYEEAGQYTEAAYAVLLHAEMLNWSETRLLPEMFGSTSMPAATRKQQLLMQAIALFDRGKAWEDAIKVSSDFCLALRYHLYDYTLLAEQLRLQADLYVKIAEQERFFSNYFYVAYFGSGFPLALRRKKFIYRGLELERIPHFISRMSKKFPNAKIITSMDPNPSELAIAERRDSGGQNSRLLASSASQTTSSTSSPLASSSQQNHSGQFLQIFTVQPSNESEMALGIQGMNFKEMKEKGDKSNLNSTANLLNSGGMNVNFNQGNSLLPAHNIYNPNMPEGTRKYLAANNVRVFHYSRPFKQPGAPKTTDENAFEHVWSAQVFVVTEDSFPNIQRRLEIVQVSETVRSPIENATHAVLQKNSELIEIINKLSSQIQNNSGQNNQNSLNLTSNSNPSSNNNNARQSSSQGASITTSPHSSIHQHQHHQLGDAKVDRLSMSLNGILDAAVNGGTAKYRNAFLSAKFIADAKGNKKMQDNIASLQQALLAQLQVVFRGLSLHAELCPSNLLALHKRLESQYERMLEATTQAASRSPYGETLKNSSDFSPSSASSSAHFVPPSSSAAKLPLGAPPLGAVRVKDADARPSVFGIAQRMSNQ